MEAIKNKNKWAEFKIYLKEKKEIYLMILPFFILFSIFTILPVVMSIILGFTDFNGVKVNNFVFFDNYINLLVDDPIFTKAIINTLVLALITGPLGYLMCFVFAWLINDLPKYLRAVMTLVFYAPSISGNAYLIWKLVFSSDIYGYANGFLKKLGIISEPIYFLTDSDYIIWILILVQLWLSLGTSFLAFVAGLKTCDKTLYEAGSIDGIKNRWQELWYITLPQMKPQLLFGAVMQITSAFSIGNLSIELFGFPTVDYAGHTIVTHLYDYGNVKFELGYSSAIATILFFTMIISNLLVQKLIRKVGK